MNVSMRCPGTVKGHRPRTNKAGIQCRLPLIGLVAGFSAVCLTTTGCGHSASDSDPAPANFLRQGDLVVIPPGSPLRSSLALEHAQANKVQSQLSATAVVEADPQKYANIFPPLTGKLIQLHVQLGDAVTNGQLLATLQSPDFFAAQDNYVKAKSVEELTRRALNRQQELWEHKIAAQKDVEQATSDYESARIDLETAAHQLQAYGFNPETDQPGQPLQVYAPLSGQVVDMASAHGEFRNDNTTPLMTVADLSTVWLTAGVPEKDLQYLTKGQEITASLVAYPGETMTGKVLFIGDLVDTDIRVAKVRIAFANPDNRLKPGMFATVKFLGFPQTQITVPTTAVVQSGDSAFVFAEVKPWVLQPKRVELGAQEGDRIVITGGLEAGDTVLTREGVIFQ